MRLIANLRMSHLPDTIYVPLQQRYNCLPPLIYGILYLISAIWYMVSVSCICYPATQLLVTPVIYSPPKKNEKSV